MQKCLALNPLWTVCRPLESQSLLLSQGKPQQHSNPITKHLSDRAPVHPNGTAHSTPSPSEASKREIKPRHPFDIYQDQLDLLRKLSIRDKMKGEIGSMSAMVREALDNYLKDKKI